jgi:hypothetical protein
MKSAGHVDRQPAEGNHSFGPVNGGPAIMLSAEEAERLLLTRLQERNQEHKGIWHRLGVLYSDSDLYEKARGMSAGVDGA